MNMAKLDAQFIRASHRLFEPLARGSIFVVYAWFGTLKALGISPAEPLVHALHDRMIGFVPFDAFYVAFACFEVLIGVLFLFPKLTRIVIPLLLVHMILTALPLIFLPSFTWTSFLVPTLTGQYILKNLAIVSCALGIAGHMHAKRIST